jgi:hypothetical protein
MLTWIAAFLAVVFLLVLKREPLQWHDPWVALFIFAHSLAIVWRLGRPGSSEGAFLYGRGFGRDTLWANAMLASALAALAVWAIGALIVWLPIRSAVLQHVFGSPYFPVMKPAEAAVPWPWLLGYATLLPVFHYVWIRAHQPWRDPADGALLAAGLVIAAFIVVLMRFGGGWYYRLVVFVALAIAVAALLATRRLHRSMEVNPCITE